MKTVIAQRLPWWDYQGLGTPGPHPYLVGDSEGMNALDSVRAAHSLGDAHASTHFVVWGESQGGQASLFTGQLASTYAPELTLDGVVASAPATDLASLFMAAEGSIVGNVLASMAIWSWAQVYDDVNLDQIVTTAARPFVAEIANNCIGSPAQILGSVPAATALKVTFLTTPPWNTEPWKTILAVNTPGGVRIAAPILITQGLPTLSCYPPSSRNSSAGCARPAKPSSTACTLEWATSPPPETLPPMWCNGSRIVSPANQRLRPARDSC